MPSPQVEETNRLRDKSRDSAAETSPGASCSHPARAHRLLTMEVTAFRPVLFIFAKYWYLHKGVKITVMKVKIKLMQ